jgi:hypothetical protein
MSPELIEHRAAAEHHRAVAGNYIVTVAAIAPE